MALWSLLQKYGEHLLGVMSSSNSMLPRHHLQKLLAFSKRQYWQPYGEVEESSWFLAMPPFFLCYAFRVKWNVIE